jgi:hypothetical protein
MSFLLRPFSSKSVAVGSNSYAHLPMEYSDSEDDNPHTPLLSSTEAGFGEEIKAYHFMRPKPWHGRYPRVAMALVAVMSLFIGVTVIAQHGLKEVHIVTYPIASSSTPTPTQIGPGNDAWHEQYQPILNDPIIGVTDVGLASAIVANSTATAWPEEPHPIALNFTHTPVKIEAGPDVSSHQPHPDDPVAAARISLDVLFARQSSNIDQATARYSLKTGRPPPRNYDKWFKFAREKSCLIDDYDQIHRDFKPFYDLAQDDPRIFQRRLEVAFDMVRVTLSALDASKTLPLDEG